jgi:hypothetical protein
LPWVSDHADSAVHLDGVEVGVTSADGTFQITDIAPGTHTLEARHAGYLSSATTVTVSGGQEVSIGETTLVAGDAEPDNTIDLADVLAAEAAFGQCSGAARYAPIADFNQNGCIDAFDVAVVLDNLGRVGPTRWVVGPR